MTLQKESKRVILVDDKTNTEIEYTHIYIHPKPEKGLLSYYIGEFDDEHRTICRITNSIDRMYGGKTIWVKPL